MRLMSSSLAEGKNDTPLLLRKRSNLDQFDPKPNEKTILGACVRVRGHTGPVCKTTTTGPVSVIVRLRVPVTP